MTVLDQKLEEALVSRDARQIRRRLPDPPSLALVDFTSNDYLSLAKSETLRSLFLQKLADAPDILGSGGSRLLVNGHAHSALENRLTRFFDAPAGLLFNSGLDANVGFFSCIPQHGDVVVYDEYIHASVHDGIRASRARDAQFGFSHNSMEALCGLLLKLKGERPGLEAGESSIFVAVESLYSMDGTFAPLKEIVEAVEEIFPTGNGHVIVDEAHATGIYGENGRGLVAMLGLENRVLARLHTFGKALAGSGAIVLTTVLLRDYMLNYARSLIYTTSLNYSSIISADCSFDMLEDGTAALAAKKLLDLAEYFVRILRPHISSMEPSTLLSLPPHLSFQSSTLMYGPIIPIHTSQARPLSAYLSAQGINARPITWPTVPKGKDRVRVCLHSGNTKEEVDLLIRHMVAWAKRQQRAVQSRL